MPSDREEGRWRLLNPLAIRFSQPRIAPHFRDGHLIDETINEVHEGALEVPSANWEARDSAEGPPPYDVVLVPPFPAVRVISWLPKLRHPSGEAERDANGDQLLGKRAWFALDNRRLYSLQNAAAKRWPRRCCVVVRCIEEVPGGNTMREIRKFRTTTQGMSIEVGARVGETHEWSWLKAAPLGASLETLEMEGLYAEDLWDATYWAPQVTAASAAVRPVSEEPRVRSLSPHRKNTPGGGSGKAKNGSRDGKLMPCPATGWQYIDPAGNVQGPFNLEKMTIWYQHGYFLPDLPMRCDGADAFVPFVNLFPAPIEPFRGHVVRYSAHRRA
mmetsp:Transcript_111136/g.313581  ORF Transcript_111136/g.313581 Transcript_111136/m.313581 type:complete len:329 (+) Transcript_111136:56-1042(+)|eukprot:CAMPEP_0117516724 /NCGR_PEP_ID=MMETSP0784-20121206/31242_1 /TAXON_ID=39447 /ORGANISM="" /LENGTH=328 /DNA_ID=CAMNT_0005312579 /DNA_START=51 /DNA_END=1037 /DNA_ORIENTATION=+